MAGKTKNGAEKKETPLYVKIFIALFAGIAFGYVLNFMGGVENEIINGYVLPFFQFIGDLFIKLIKMIVVPLVFFCIIDAALSLGDIKKLRSIGVKTIIWFLATGGISATIGLILANIIKPGRGLQLGTAETAMEVKELPGIYQTLLDLIPSNPFQALTSGEMMQIIVFSLFLGFAIISIGKEAQHKCGGFDHAGKWETSLMMGTYPDHVDLSRCDRNTEWFAKSAVEASEELGHHMVSCTLEWLRETIV